MTNAEDLTGRRFGRWVVLGPAPSDGAAKWRCRCDCGGECLARADHLASGRTHSCGCETRRRARPAVDLTGRRFGMLTALAPTQARDPNGSVVWRCRCDCGKETNAAADRFRDGGVTSCGCRRAQWSRALHLSLSHVAGTSIDALRSKRVRVDNPTGVRGVREVRGLYVAQITLQQRRYRLGAYPTLEQAARARRAAEQVLHDDFVNFYDRWKRRAEADPAWAEANPVSLRVERDDGGEFRVEMRPSLDASVPC